MHRQLPKKWHWTLPGNFHVERCMRTRWSLASLLVMWILTSAHLCTSTAQGQPSGMMGGGSTNSSHHEDDSQHCEGSTCSNGNVMSGATVSYGNATCTRTFPTGKPAKPMVHDRRVPPSAWILNGACTQGTLDTRSERTSQYRLVLGAVVQFSPTYNLTFSACTGIHDWEHVQHASIILAATRRRSRLWEERFGGSPFEEAERFSQSKGNAPYSWLGAKVEDGCGFAIPTLLQYKQFSGSAVSALITRRFFAQNVNQLYCETPLCNGAIPAVLGPNTDEEVVSASEELYSAYLPHVSHWATMDISQTDRNARDPLLFRILPPDSAQVRMMFDFAVAHNWTYIIFIQSSETAYGSQALRMFTDHVKSSQKKICIALLSSISARNTSSLSSTVEKIKDLPAAVGIIVYATRQDSHAFFNHLGPHSKSLVESHVWFISNDYASFLENHDQPALRDAAVLLSLPWTDWHLSNETVRYFEDELEKDRLLSNMTRLHSNSFLCRYFEQQQHCNLRKYLPEPCESRFEHHHEMPPACNTSSWRPPVKRPLSAKLRSVMASVERLLDALEETLAFRLRNRSRLEGYDCVVLLPGEQVARALKNLTGKCPYGGSCSLFTTTQGGQPIFNLTALDHRSSPPAELVLHTWEQGKGGKFRDILLANITSLPAFARLAKKHPSIHGIPVSVCAQDCPPGKWQSISATSSCCWVCKSCKENTYSAATNSHACLTCAVGTVSNSTACAPLVGEFVRFSSPWGIVISTMTVFLFIVLLGSIGFYYVNRESVLIRASDLNVSFTLLISLVFSLATVPLMMATPSTMQCQLSFLLLFPPIWFSQALMLWKTARLAYIVKRTRRLRTARKSILFRPWMHIACSLAVVAAGEVPSILGFFLSPPTLRDKYPTFKQRLSVCTWLSGWSAATVAFTLVLLLTLCVFGFQSRALPANFNEARHIWMATSVVCVAWAGMMPALYINQDILQPVILAWLVVAYNGIIWGFLFLPRMYKVVWFTPQKVCESVPSTMMNLGMRQSSFFSTSQKTLHNKAVAKATNSVLPLFG